MNLVLWQRLGDEILVHRPEKMRKIGGFEGIKI